MSHQERATYELSRRMVSMLHTTILEAYGIIAASRREQQFPPTQWTDERLQDAEEALASLGFELAGVLLGDEGGTVMKRI